MSDLHPDHQQALRRLIEVRHENENLSAVIVNLRTALKPFADCAAMMERNSYVDGLDIISRQHGRILGHIGFAWPELLAALEAYGRRQQKVGES